LRALRAPGRCSINVIRLRKSEKKNIFGGGGNCHPLYDHVGSRLLANAMIQRVHNIECHRCKIQVIGLILGDLDDPTRFRGDGSGGRCGLGLLVRRPSGVAIVALPLEVVAGATLAVAAIAVSRAAFGPRMPGLSALQTVAVSPPLFNDIGVDASCRLLKRGLAATLLP
jgi:hypothetical protein